MKKIIFFRPLFYIGGTEIAILNLIKKLKGFDIYVGYTDETSDKKVLNEFSKYAKVINLKEENNLNFDYFVACSMHYHLDEAVNKIKRDKTILWVHHLINIENSILSNENYNEIDNIVTVSKTISKKIIKLFPQLKSKVKTIYNVIFENEIKEKSLDEYHLNLSNELNLVTVSRVCKAKGFDRMLALAKHLKKSGINFKWFIVGGNYYEKDYQEIINDFDEFKDNFEWLGFMDNPHKIVRKCDYSVLLSDDETWGLVLTEAMILGVPCITTDFDVVFEQIEDKKNGIILSRDDLESYKNRIDEILFNKNKYKKAVSKFKYNHTKIIKEWGNILNES